MCRVSESALVSPISCSFLFFLFRIARNTFRSITIYSLVSYQEEYNEQPIYEIDCLY